jgi:ferredoxin/nitrate reductase gamma subunit
MTELVASGVPYRDTFWNIPMWARVFVYVGGTAAIAVFAWGCWQRVSLWLKGKPERRTDRLPERIVLVLTQALGQARILSQAYPGVMHAIVFWGFLALFIGTVLATIDYDITLPLLHVKLLKGTFYLLYELVLDMFGLFFVVGLGMACWRRFVARPSRIDPTPKFAYALLILFVINATGFVMEACRLAVVKPAWAAWSPVGYVLGQVMLAVGLGEGALRGIHLSVWVFHAAIAFVFIALIPQPYFMHLVTTPLNIFFSKLRPRGELAKIENIEEAENLGVSKFEEFSWKRRLDFDACVECGRCQDACPAYISGSALNPKRIIVKLKRYMLDGDTRPIHGEVIQHEDNWACTTCMACVRRPAYIDIGHHRGSGRFPCSSEAPYPPRRPWRGRTSSAATRGLAPTERLNGRRARLPVLVEAKRRVSLLGRLLRLRDHAIRTSPARW